MRTLQFIYGLIVLVLVAFILFALGTLYAVGVLALITYLSDVVRRAF